MKTEKIIEYQDINKQVNEIRNEDEKTDFITTLDDNDLKLEFLKKVKTKKDKDKIIQSLTRNVEPRIKGQVELVEKMIRDTKSNRI